MKCNRDGSKNDIEIPILILQSELDKVSKPFFVFVVYWLFDLLLFSSLFSFVVQ